MNGVALLIAVSSLGVDYSYRTADDGRLEYTIQIEPEFLKSLADGEEIHSDVPPDVGNVERLVIRVGTTPARHSAAQIAEYKRLRVSSGRYASRDTTLTTADTLPTIFWPAKNNPEETFTVDYGWQPDQAAQLAYYIQVQPTLLSSLAVGDEIHAPVEPAVGRVGRFVILSGNKQLPRVGGQPEPAPETKLAGASSSRSRFQTGTSQTYGPPVSGSTSGGANQNNPRTFTPAANNELSPAEEPAYVPRSRFNSTTSDQGGFVAPASDPLAPPPYQPGFEQPRSTFNQPRTNDQGAAPRTGYQNQYQPPAGTLQPPNDQYAQQGGFNPPAGYVPQPGYAPPAYQQPADNRVASVTRETTTASTPLPAPQVTANTTAPAAAATTSETERPWWPLMFTCFALFLSIGGNLYLGWTAAEFYNRYRLATDRLRAAART